MPNLSNGVVTEYHTRMSLRSQINVLITALMLLFVTALAIFEVDATRRSIREEMEAATRVTVQLLTNVIQNEQVFSVTPSPRVLVAFLEHLGRVRAHEIQLYNAAGEPLYHSPPSRYKEGRSAPLWFSRLVAPETKLVELKVGAGRLTITPDPSRSVLDAWDDLLKLFWLSMGFFVLANLLVFWFASRSLHPIQDILQGLKRMELGQFHVRLPRFKLPELAAISDTFNRMAQAVEESFAVKKRAEQTEHELQENRALTQLIQRHIEEERRNLALELHDELGQSVTAVKTIAASMVNRTRERHPEIASAAQMIVEVSGRMYDAMHGMVRRLRPLALDKLGLRDAIQELVAAQRALHPQLEFKLAIDGELDDIDDTVRIAVYRVVQECLTNIVRHAGATQASVKIARPGAEANERLVVEVHDDGKGMPSAAPSDEEHFGVLGMRERVEGLGGEFSLETRKEGGVTVRAELPLKVIEKALI
jgi:two-component system, NarL family, sensor histidine kinase UhpB